MPLNLISDEAAASAEEFFGRWLAPGREDIARYEAHKHLGFLAWRKGDAVRMRTHLVSAAEQAVAFVEQRDLDNTEAVREAIDFEPVLMLAIAFGDSALRLRLARLPRALWCQPADPAYGPLADLFDLLRMAIPGQAIDREAILQVARHNRAPDASAFFRPWIDAMCAGLLAIAERDADGAVASVDTLLGLHRERALEGDLQRLAEGLVATWALVLKTLAQERGLSLAVDSPYLPPLAAAADAMRTDGK
jgi:hypothetical protein